MLAEVAERVYADGGTSARADPEAQAPFRTTATASLPARAAFGSGRHLVSRHRLGGAIRVPDGSTPSTTRSALGVPGEQLVVGLLADPDLPAQVARHLADRLPDELSAQVSSEVDWKLEVVDEPFEVITRYERVIDKARVQVEGKGWDLALCVTDMPLQTANGVIVAMISLHDRVALISLPALGGIRIRRRARRIAVAIIDELTGLSAERSTDRSVQLADSRRRTEASRLTRRATPTDRDVDIELITPARRGSLRLLAGMVRANRPWQLSLGLSTALAGAATGSAFGILYSALWVLANVLEPWRLAAFTLAAIMMLAVWLLAGHGLWARPPQPERRAPLGNVATVLTVGYGVLVFYLALLVMNLAAAGLIIPPHYMAETLGHAVGLADYLRVAVLATGLGTIAGAVGSGLEDDETVRRAAYSTREQERWRFVRQ